MEEHFISKVNRRGRQDRQMKPHRPLVGHRPWGLPKEAWPKSRRYLDRRLAIMVKKAQGKGLPKRKR